MPSHTTENIEIVLNGDSRAVPAGLNLVELLEALGVDPGKVAVELDRSIVRKTDWPKTMVGPGAQLEIVQFVGGG